MDERKLLVFWTWWYAIPKSKSSNILFEKEHGILLSFLWRFTNNLWFTCKCLRTRLHEVKRAHSGWRLKYWHNRRVTPQIKFDWFKLSKNPADAILIYWGTQRGNELKRVIEILRKMKRHDVVEILEAKGGLNFHCNQQSKTSYTVAL